MRILCIAALLLNLISCTKPSSETVVVGTISGPETDLVAVAKKVAFEQDGIDVKIVEFNDYNLPNEALEDGSLDVNVYQHGPYLKAAMAAHHYHLKAIGKTFVYPTGIYSNKIKSLNELRSQAVIALPNDPSNEARALLLLQQAGLITLKKTPLATLNDITENPKHLNFKELDAAQLPRVLTDVDAAVINTTFAIPAGLRPTRDAIFIENKDSPYANLIVIREDSHKKEQIERFVKALHSKEVKEKAQELFGDAAIPAWDH